MTFYEVVNQVIASLQREGRASYRALKREFNLTNNSLEDLKDELIEAKRLAVDEDGKVLVLSDGARQPLTPYPQAARHRILISSPILVASASLGCYKLTRYD